MLPTDDSARDSAVAGAEVLGPVIESANCSAVPVNEARMLRLRRKTPYDSNRIWRLANCVCEVLLWPDYYRIFNCTRIPLEAARTQYEVPSYHVAGWYNKYRVFPKVKIGKKPKFVAIYVTTNSWCVLEATDMRQKERTLKKIFKYRE